MRPSIVALALLGTGLGSAGAQTAVNVYGALDAGVVNERACDGCGTRIASGMAYPSRLGLGGSVASWPDVPAVVRLDAGLLLGSGPTTHLVGSGEQVVDSSIEYISRAAHRITARTLYSNADDPRDPSDKGNRAWGVSFGFESGPLVLRAAHQNRHVTQIVPALEAGNRMEAKNTILAANLRMGGGTAYTAYSVNRGWGSSPLWNPDNPYGAAISTTPSTRSRDVLLGYALPQGAVTYLASYIRKNDLDLADRDAHQFAFGATYLMSRHTDFYAAYSVTKNRHGAGYAIGNAAAIGRPSSALNLGMRHAF